MRLMRAFLFLCVALLGTESLAANVLVPEDKPTASPASPSLGLVPSQQTIQPKPAPAATDIPLATIPAAQSQANTPATTAPMPTLDQLQKNIPSGLQTMSKPANSSDPVDTAILKSLRVDDIRQYLPDEMKGMSQDDYKKMIDYYDQSMKKNDFMKYLKTDPKTGQKYLDTSTMEKDVEAAQKEIDAIRSGEKMGAPVAITPGGKLAPRVYTKEEALLAKLVANAPKKQLDPRIQQAMAMAREDQRQRAEKNARDPLILADLNMEPYDGPFLKKSVPIGLAAEYIWGREDIKRITESLGYEEQEIPANCQVRLNTYLETDSAMKSYRLSLYSNTQRTIRYDGVVKSMSATPIAVCYKPKKALPRKGDILFRISDKYGVSLSPGNCAAPARDPKTQSEDPEGILMTYKGDGKVECAFKYKN